MKNLQRATLAELRDLPDIKRADQTARFHFQVIYGTKEQNRLLTLLTGRFCYDDARVWVDLHETENLNLDSYFKKLAKTDELMVTLQKFSITGELIGEESFPVRYTRTLPVWDASSVALCFRVEFERIND